MDALSEILKSVKLHSTVHCRSQFSAPWGVQIESMIDASFHVVMRGNCWLEVEGVDAQIPLVGGDLVVLPRGVAHTLRDRPDSPTVMLRALLADRPCQGQLTLNYGGGGTVTTVLCGKASFENHEINPLLAALPPLVLIKGEEGQAVEWLDSTLQFIACETASNRPGAEMMITYLSNVLFIQAVRAYLTTLKQQDDGGWLRALVDPQLSTALALIHQHPGTDWTVESLAKQVSMSRSGFAARFKWLMGEAPLQYITRWRMYRAVELLRSGNLNVAEIAERVGYDSETAFSKAFKRQMGQPPNQYRKQGKVSSIAISKL
ncbi:AraC family transcriptional regulator [Phormidium tenue FACHB-886]|nr:AraC family transcriptional regulator [Phormidium tenue FACHB-886]